MDEKLLYGMRREPPHEFADRLKDRLRAQEPAPPGPRGRRLSGRVATIVFVTAVTALLLMLPQVRTSAEAFLSLFRVVNFVAIPVDEDRVRTLRSQQLDLPHLIGDRVEVLENPGPPTPFLTPDLAAAAGGFELKLPSVVPPDMVMTKVELAGARALRVTADTARLRELLSSLGIDDVSVPETLDGQTATIRVSPVLMVAYEYQDRKVNFLQAHSPEVSLPAGVDLPALAEIGLRVLGLDRAEAQRFAQAVDWQTTLLVPVPANVSSFRQADIAGHRGLIVETAAPNTAAGRRQRVTMVLWSDQDRVFSLHGNVAPPDLLAMANSVS